MQQKVNLTVEELGVNAFDGYKGTVHNSASRKCMAANQKSKACTPIHSDLPRIISPIQAQTGNFVFDIRIDDNSEVVSVHDKFKVGLFGDAISYNPVKIIILRNIETGEYDLVEIVDDWNMHTNYGHQYKKSPIIYKLSQGMFLQKDTILCQSPNIKDGNIWSNSIYAETIYMSDSAVIEDAFKISESFANKGSLTEYETHVITYGQRSYPLNIMGNDKVFKPWGDIGDKIRDDGLVFATRDFSTHVENTIGMSNKMLQRILRGTDNLVFGTPGATIVDINVESGIENFEKYKTPESMLNHTKKYLKQITRFQTEIINMYDDIVKYHQRNYRSMPSFTPRFISYAANAFSIMTNTDRIKKQNGGIVKKTYRKNIINEIRVTIKTRYIRPLNKGAKFVGYHGNKGVVGCIVPDEEMPIDKNGNRADVIFGPRAPVARLDLGQNYEQEINACSRDLSKWVKDNYNKLSNDVIWERLYRYYCAANTKFHLHDSLYTKKFIDDHILKVFNEGIYLIAETISEDQQVELIERIHDVIMAELTPVTYRQSNGKYVTTKDDMLIGGCQYIVLDNTWISNIAVSMSPLQHHGLLAGSSRLSRTAYPARTHATVNFSETEVRLFASLVGPDVMAEFMALANNIDLHKALVKSLIKSDKPSTIEDIEGRENIKTSSRNVELIRHFLLCFGLKIEK